VVAGPPGVAEAIVRAARELFAETEI